MLSRALVVLPTKLNVVSKVDFLKMEKDWISSELNSVIFSEIIASAISLSPR
jgi:hypothetical protein